jgi:hypothetical protein
METISRIFDRYLEYFSPTFLFLNGDPILRHHAGSPGALYVFMVPFIIAGIYLIYKKSKGDPYLRFLLLGVIVYPLAAVVTIDHWHSTRTMNGSIVWALTAVVGAEYMLRKRGWKLFGIAFFAIIAFALIESAVYMGNYFGVYVQKSRIDFAAPLTEAFEYSFKNLKPGETLYISASAIPQRINSDFKPFWYSYLLFFGKVPPPVYQKSGIPAEYICAYRGQQLRKGLLVRNNIIDIRDDRGKSMAVINSEPVPENSMLITEISIIKDTKLKLEVYRLK